MLFSINTISIAQTLEHTYTTNGAIENQPNYSFIANGSINYFTIDKANNKIKLYDNSHNLFKIISLNLNNTELIAIHLITQELFDTDTKIEFLLEIKKTITPFDTFLYIMNEDGRVITSFGNATNFKLIKTPNNHYKLIISKETTNSDELTYDVYGLSGTLSTEQENLLKSSMVQYPNPAIDLLNIINIRKGKKLEIYSLNGKKILSKKINENEDRISIDISDLNSGIYLYKIGNETNKFIKK